MKTYIVEEKNKELQTLLQRKQFGVIIELIMIMFK
jgi:hypothetical protein